WLLVRDLIARIRKRYPDCVIVGGGEHFNAAAEYSLANSDVDICVLGEGEATARELIERMTASAGAVPLDVPGTMVRERSTGRVIRNAPRARIKDLASVPLPAWESFNV